LKRENAELLAQRIKDYWAARGKKVRTRVEEFSNYDKEGKRARHLYFVRSDMLAGSPRP
jgi:hypothetical protein